MSFIDGPDLKASKESKSKKKEEPTAKEESIKVGTHDMFRELKIGKDNKVVVIVANEVTLPLQDGQETNETRESVRSVKSDWEPHDDLLDSMKAMKKYALEMAEIEDKSTSNYNVVRLKITGDLEMQTARAHLWIGKKIKRTGKISVIDCGEVVVYGESDFKNIDKLRPLIEKVSDESILYVGGKGKHPAQIPLF